jgi:excisionase family DNA binding protein
MVAISPGSTGRRALKVKEFCRAYGPSKPTVYRLIRSGELHSILLGGRRLIPVDTAEALLHQPSTPIGPSRRTKQVRS